MLRRLVDLYTFVHSVQSNSSQNIRELALLPEDVYQMRELVTVLELLCEVAQGKGGEKYSSIALVKPMLTTLMSKTLTVVESDTPVVFELKKAALDDLKTKYSKVSVKALMAQTTLLDPRFKDFCHIYDKDQRLKLLEEARKELLSNSLLTKMITDQHPMAMNSSDAFDEPPMKKSKSEDAIFTFLLSAMCEYDESDRPLTSDQAVVARISNELKIYGAERVNGNVDPIKFWLDATSTFPLLCKMALNLLSIPVTSVPCERAFSRSGLVVDDLCSHVKKNFLVFLQNNADL